MSDPLLRTVKVPDAMVPIFLQAEEVVSRYFRERRDLPEHGSIEIFGQRYILVRAASLSVEFFSLVADLYGPGREEEADGFARNILFDLAHAVGRSDARNFHTKMGVADPMARLSAGPVHFAHTGWAFVDILPESKPSPDRDFYLLYDHPYSFESTAWLEAKKSRAAPVCIMNAGYSSGWCEESFGVQLVSSEILCRSKGDACCRFIMGHPERIEGFVRAYLAKSPALAARSGGWQIPDFFSRKRLEEELRRSRDELEARVEQRTQELWESKERLRQTQKLEAIGRLAGGIAHDFNNLLTVIQGANSLALEELQQGLRPASLLEEVQQAADRAATLTHQLLAFSRQQVLAPQVLDVNGVVVGLLGMLRRLIGEHIQLEFRPGVGLGRIRADAGQMEQVLVNLAVNARDAMPGGGKLLVVTRSAASKPDSPGGKGLLQLLVQDSGPGMPAEALAHLFEPFFTTKERGKGTGLGLATVYGIITQSGGTVGVSSEPGQGTLFTISLPVADEPLPTAQPSAPQPAEPAATATILLVEDEPLVRSLFAKVLAARGYRVLQAGDPLVALEEEARFPGTIDLLLTDVVMPHLGGKELAERLLARRPGLRVLYMSGYTEHIIKQDGSPTGRGAFIAKPCQPAALLAKVRLVLQAPGVVTGPGDASAAGSGEPAQK